MSQLPIRELGPGQLVRSDGIALVGLKIGNGLVVSDNTLSTSSGTSGSSTQGEKGDKGEKGDRGETGATGPAGSDGDGLPPLFGTTADPNGSVTGSVGQLYKNTSTGELWIKHTGDLTDTGWI